MHHRRDRTLLVAASAALALALGVALPASASAAAGFSSSFEPGDPQPTWANTVDTGTKRSSGVSGPKRTGIPGDVTDKVVAVRASGENTGGGEVKENLVDGSPQTKWLVFASTGWAEFELSQPIAVVRTR